jgi:ribulose 1,5-bisphosphate synthetase/thiazole synthase
MKRLSRVFSGSPKPVASEKEAQAPQQAVKTVIEQRSVDEGRPLRVVVIGAGISGILACIRFVQRIPNLDLCIYDKNADIGGTWVEVSTVFIALFLNGTRLLPAQKHD